MSTTVITGIGELVTNDPAREGLLGLVHVAEGVSLKAWLFAPLRALPVDPRFASLLFAVGFVAVFYGIAWAMWRRGWIVKV